MATEWILTEGTPYPHLSDVERLPDFGYSDFAEPYPTWMWRLVSVHQYPYLAPLTPVDTSFPSEAYRTAIASHSRRSKVTGTITQADAEPIKFTDADIVGGSLHIFSEMVSDDFLISGGVPSAEMDVCLFTDVEDIALYGAEISLSFWLYIDELEGEDDAKWYEVPLGVYTISDAVQDVEEALTITAYDDMSKLDGIRFDALSEHFDANETYTPFQIIAVICETAGITLHTSQAEFDELRNGDIRFCVRSITSGIDTARDLLMHVCQIIGCFAYIDRWREMRVQRVGYDRDDEPAPSATITRDQTFTGYTSKLVYQVASVRLHAVMYGDGNEVIDDTQYAARPIGVNMEMPDNPLWSVVRDETETWRDAVLLRFHRLCDEFFPIMYRPCACSTIGDPSLTLGDWISCRGEMMPLTGFDWRYHGQMDIRACGREAIAEVAKSQRDKAALAAKENALWFSLTVMRDIYLRMMQYYMGLKGFTHKEIGQFTYKQIEEGKA